ncbi:MAG: 50S ribosomal protein L24 [Spirochaetes bacterium GWF1_41_5]|nr:MAG: 50S ribosomal protein L24 [Spirochaetes bacterium GWF1_41_5]
MKLKFRKNDIVRVISGKEKGKEGKITEIDRVNLRVKIEGINKIKKGIKRTREDQKGGFVEKELPLHVSKIMLIDPQTQKLTRIGIKTIDGKKIRYAKKSNTELDK